MSPKFMAVSAAAALAAALAAAPAEARRGGGSDYQDSSVNDAVKNPRLIEPGAQNLYGNRAYYGREGYDDRVRAQRGYSYGDPYPRQGRVTVRPYGY